MSDCKVKYVVLDIETTGLDPQKDAILEIGAIAVDADANRWRSLLSLLVQPESVNQIENISDVARQMHTNNGLLAELADGAGFSLAVAEGDLCQFFRALGCEERSVILVGHTVSFDHGFLNAKMPEAAKFLSHRMLDISVPARLMRDLGYNITTYDMPHRAFKDAMCEAYELREIICSLKYAKKALDLCESIGKEFAPECDHEYD